MSKYSKHFIIAVLLYCSIGTAMAYNNYKMIFINKSSYNIPVTMKSDKWSSGDTTSFVLTSYPSNNSTRTWTGYTQNSFTGKGTFDFDLKLKNSGITSRIYTFELINPGMAPTALRWGFRSPGSTSLVGTGSTIGWSQNISSCAQGEKGGVVTIYDSHFNIDLCENKGNTTFYYGATKYLNDSNLTSDVGSGSLSSLEFDDPSIPLTSILNYADFNAYFNKHPSMRDYIKKNDDGSVLINDYLTSEGSLQTEFYLDLYIKPRDNPSTPAKLAASDIQYDLNDVAKLDKEKLSSEPLMKQNTLKQSVTVDDWHYITLNDLQDLFFSGVKLAFQNDYSRSVSPEGGFYKNLNYLASIPNWYVDGKSTIDFDFFDTEPEVKNTEVLSSTTSNEFEQLGTTSLVCNNGSINQTLPTVTMTVSRSFSNSTTQASGWQNSLGGEFNKKFGGVAVTAEFKANYNYSWNGSNSQSTTTTDTYSYTIPSANVLVPPGNCAYSVAKLRVVKYKANLKASLAIDKKSRKMMKFTKIRDYGIFDRTSIQAGIK